MTTLHGHEEHIERDGETRSRTESIRSGTVRPHATGDVYNDDERAIGVRPDSRDVHFDERVVDERSVRYAQLNTATVNGVLGILLVAPEGLLAVRFMLVAFGASTRSGFVRFILDFSHPFVRPFSAAFADRTWDQGIVEPGTMLAMGVYVLIFALAMMFISALMPQLTERHGTERRRVSHD